MNDACTQHCLVRWSGYLVRLCRTRGSVTAETALFVRRFCIAWLFEEDFLHDIEENLVQRTRASRTPNTETGSFICLLPKSSLTFAAVLLLAALVIAAFVRRRPVTGHEPAPAPAAAAAISGLAAGRAERPRRWRAQFLRRSAADQCWRLTPAPGCVLSAAEVS